jgi:tRNA (guanine37-N1)-methyltransferase
MARPPNSGKEPSSKSSSKKSARAALEFHILTLFPEVFGAVLDSSLLGKARQKGLVSFNLTQIRDFATDRHRTVDDTPYGGGEGMLLKADVLHAAWQSARGRRKKGVATILLSPQGAPLTQALAKELAANYSKLILVCGHYEGVDERFIELCVDREVSIGDYVLTGGELPAMVLADAVTRVLPGVVGNSRSVERDSLEGGLLKYPQYTRPREFQGVPVPEVLLGGDHGAIARWRENEARQRTARKRPDLWDAYITGNPHLRRQQSE